MKRFFKYLLASMLLVGGFSGCNKNNDNSSSSYQEPDMTRTYTKLESDSLYVRKVENIGDDFIMGMDASSVIAQEESGVKYYDYNGQEEDVFKVLSDSGINYIRVRVWNDPFNKDGKGYGGGNCDINTAIKIGKRATKYKMKLLVDFHYSDFWADPAKQQAPKAWANMDYQEKSVAIYEYTKDCLLKLQQENIAVGMVQVGNETNGGKMAGETRFSFFAGLFNQGAKAVREVYPNALVAVHFANPEKTANYLDWAKKLKTNNVDYDVFGSSYYPYWHGTLDNLTSVLSEIAETYNKKTMVLETSYAYTEENFDFWNNTIGTSGFDDKFYPFTIAGQANSIIDIIDAVANDTTNGIGVCYWEGTWNAVGTSSYEANQLLWEKHGSGWATSYASDYDPDDAGKWYGGCAVENQAMFDSLGKPLESLKLFNLVRFGNDAPKYIDGIEDAYITHYTYEDFDLPETVNVIYNDNSKEAIPVVWEAFDIEAAKAQGNGKHTIKGVASNQEVYCYLTIMEYNFTQNYSFEDKNISPWVVNNLSETALSDTYKAQVTAENPQTGTNAFHFWAQEADTVKIEVEQELTLETSGTYKYQISLLGGYETGESDPETQNNYAYVKINDEIVYQEKGYITSYNGGYSDILIENIQYNVGDKIVIGFHIECSEAGVWGDVDDALFNFVA